MTTSFTIPKGWFVTGSAPHLFAMGLDPSEQYGDKAASTIQSVAGVPPPTDFRLDFGTLMQWFKAAQFRGKRLRYSAVVKSDVQDGWVGLWMRVDGYDPITRNGMGEETLAFDNMESRPITGVTQWTQHEVILDVPFNATTVALGILLAGNGNVWFADVKLDEVDKTISTTNRLTSVLPQPTNLDFCAS